MRQREEISKLLKCLFIFSLVILLYPRLNVNAQSNELDSVNPSPFLPTLPSSQYYFRSFLPLLSKPIPVNPHATLSRYITSLDSTTMYNMGCLDGMAGTIEDFVILDFGAPWIDYSITPHKYGVQLMDYQSYKYIDEIKESVKNYLRGYQNCSPEYAHITIAIGTNNSGQTYYLSSEHGQAWADMINQIEEWIKSPPSWEAQMTAAGGIDIEFSWNTYATTINWVNGYDLINTRPYYNYGTCDSCPYRDHTDWIPANGWSLENAYYISWGVLPAYIIPEIYAKNIPPCNGFQAYQWQNLKSIYTGMLFSGVITQYDACHDPSNPYGFQCISSFQDNTPQEGWLLFWTALNSNPSTVQPILPWSTDFSWKN